ncbi:uncharacterized protein LOC106132629 isoform X3 [Amyelois transitella]|uniref:uncharacterized protein LOC106132629 isoform X3 n=1 Tax=Amyelois transitella TaxID=680683 RepID=UPI00298F9192|nr:uncharacterized protein LOC106132629 isoform X3 [Amyelois transitella]
MSTDNRKSSTISIDYGRRKSSTKPKLLRTYQPTYQLNPKKRFKEDDVKKILKRVVDPELEEVEYSEKEVPEVILNLAEIVRNAIKDENYNSDCQQDGAIVTYPAIFGWDGNVLLLL